VDFIEQWFHVAPDAGSGVLEAIYAVTGAAVVAALVLRRRIASFVARRHAPKAASRRP
jgi:MYXO-CTERM domain-containing protein